MAAINIKTTNTELTDALRAYVNEKINALGRHLDKEPANIDIELEYMTVHRSGPVFRCEIMFDLPGGDKMIRAESVEVDMYAAIDTCLPKIKDQLEVARHKRDTLVKRGGRKLKQMMQKMWD